MTPVSKKSNLGMLSRTLHFVGSDVRPHHGLIAGGVMTLLLNVMFRITEPWPIKIVIDSVVEMTLHRREGPWSTAPMIVTCAELLAVIVGLRAASSYTVTVCFVLAGSRVVQSLQAHIPRHVQGLSRQSHAYNRGVDTVQYIVGDANWLQEVAITAGLSPLASTTTLLVMVIVTMVPDPLLTAMVVVVVVLFLFVSRGSSQRITAATRRARKGENQLASTAQKSLALTPITQAYGLEGYIAGRFDGASGKAIHQDVKLLHLAARLERFMDLSADIAIAIVLVGGGLRVLSDAMSVGDLILFTSYLRTTVKPLRGMAKHTGRISRAGVSGERITGLMGVRQDIVDVPGALHLAVIDGSLEFDRIVTEYDGIKILHSLSLSVCEDERVAIINPSGFGKSTLVSLAVRAQDPVSNHILMGGYSLTDLIPTAVRSNVTLLYQDAMLSATTIYGNIRPGHEGTTDGEVVATAEATGAHNFIMKILGGYDVKVDKYGGALSGGQHQRTAITRTPLRDTSTIILNEATTDLDPESIGLTLDVIGDLVLGRTALAATHGPPIALRSSHVMWIGGGHVLLNGVPARFLKESEAFRGWVASAASASVSTRGGSVR